MKSDANMEEKHAYVPCLTCNIWSLCRVRHHLEQVTPLISCPMCPLTWEWMLSTHYASVYSRMWPSTWIFDCVLPLSASLSHSLAHYLHLSVSLSLSWLFLSIHCQISGISPGRCSSNKAKANGRSVFLSCLILYPSTTKSSHIPENVCDKILFRNKCINLDHRLNLIPTRMKNSCLWQCVHLKSDSLTPLSLIMTFELPSDHETSSSHHLPREPQETGSCDTVVYAAMERPITAVTWQVTWTDGTMWTLFSNKFQFPWGPSLLYRTYVAEMSAGLDSKQDSFVLLFVFTYNELLDFHWRRWTIYLKKKGLWTWNELFISDILTTKIWSKLILFQKLLKLSKWKKHLKIMNICKSHTEACKFKLSDCQRKKYYQ